MDDPIIVFLALLAVLCQVFVEVTWLSWLLALTTKKRAAIDTLTEVFAPVALPFAFAVATVTMTGSLFMSEIKHFTPCRLCWIQRGLLYPQVIWMALLWWRPRLRPLRWVALTMLAIDVLVATYHYTIEWFPSLHGSVCDPKNPCTLVWFREFGYVSLPLMSLTSALTVMTLLWMSRRNSDTTD